MTVVVRKGNIVATDSLVYNGRYSSTSDVTLENKIKKNNSNTVIIIFTGNNFGGQISSILNNISNLIVEKLLNGNILLESKDLPKEFKEKITSISLNNEILDFSCIFITKEHTFLLKALKTDLEPSIEIFHYKSTELVYFGGGSEIVAYSQDKYNKHPVDLVQEAINGSMCCCGPINVFNLNQLNEIKLL